MSIFRAPVKQTKWNWKIIPRNALVLWWSAQKCFYFTSWYGGGININRERIVHASCLELPRRNGAINVHTRPIIAAAHTTFVQCGFGAQFVVASCLPANAIDTFIETFTTALCTVLDLRTETNRSYFTCQSTKSSLLKYLLLQQEIIRRIFHTTIQFALIRRLQAIFR